MALSRTESKQPQYVDQRVTHAYHLPRKFYYFVSLPKALLPNMLWCFLVLVFLSVVADHKPAHVYRVVVHSINTTDPEVGLADVTDCGHAEYLSINAPNNIFTPAQANQLDVDTEQFLEEFYGVNISLSNPSVLYNPANCQRILFVNGAPFAIMLPFKENHNFTIRVYTDTLNTKRGTEQEPEWAQIVYSNLFVFLTDGVVASGRNAGRIFKSKWALTYGYSYYVRAGFDLRDSKNIEGFRMRSTRIGPGQLNDHGYFQYTPLVEVTALADGRTCLYIDNQQVDVTWGANNTGAFTRSSGDMIVCGK
jgi:hypothetical protein